MHPLLRAALLVAAGLLPATAAARPPQDPPPDASQDERPDPFVEASLPAALKMARFLAKDAIVAFYGPDCAACDELDATTFADERVLAWLKERVLVLRLRAPDDALARAWRVTQRPTLLLLTGHGDELDRLTGYVGPDALLEAAGKVYDGTDGLEHARARVAAHPDDAWAHIQLVRSLKSRHLWDDMLPELLWFFDHTRGDPAWRDLRDGEVVRELGVLASGSSAAKDELVERRKAALELLRAAPATVADEDAPKEAELVLAARDVRLINHELDQAKQTLKVWDEVRARSDRSAAVAAELFDWEALGLLRQARRYRDILEAVPDPVVAIEARVADVRSRQATDEEGDEDAANVPDPASNRVVSEAETFYEALLAMGREQDAADLADLMFLLDQRPITFTSFIRAAKRAGRIDLARAAYDRGMEILTVPIEKEQLRRFGGAALGGH